MYFTPFSITFNPLSIDIVPLNRAIIKFRYAILILLGCFSTEKLFTQPIRIIEASGGFSSLSPRDGIVTNWSNGMTFSIGAVHGGDDGGRTSVRYRYSGFPFSGSTEQQSFFSFDSIAYYSALSGERSGSHELTLEFRSAFGSEEHPLIVEFGWGMRALTIGTIVRTVYRDTVAPYLVSSENLQGTGRLLIKGLFMLGGGTEIALTPTLAFGLIGRISSPFDFDEPVFHAEIRLQYRLNLSSVPRTGGRSR